MSKTMVIFDDRTRSFRCAGCLSEPYEVNRYVMADQEAFVQARERLEEDHKECPQYADARLARNAYQVKRRMKREISRLRPGWFQAQGLGGAPSSRAIGISLV